METRINAIVNCENNAEALSRNKLSSRRGRATHEAEKEGKFAEAGNGAEIDSHVGHHPYKIGAVHEPFTTSGQSLLGISILFPYSVVMRLKKKDRQKRAGCQTTSAMRDVI